MSWQFRTMIVGDTVVDTCRSLAQLLAGEGQVLWTTPLSSEGVSPATHWISSGLIDQQFADLLPLSEWSWIVDDEDTGAGHWQEQVVSPGNAAVLAQMSTEAGSEMTPEEIELMFTECSVSMEDSQSALARMGLQMVQEEV